MAFFDEAGMQAFDGKEYLRTRFNGPPSEVRSNYLVHLHYIISKYHDTWDSQAAHMLDFGCGPTIYTLIPASPFVKDITLADYAESNRQEIELWKNNDKEAHNWLPYFEHVVSKIEGCTEASAAANREKQVRQKIKEVVFCDLRLNNPLPNASLKTFDIIISVGCLAVCCSNFQEFESGVKKLANLLNLNGYLISGFVLGGTWWTQGNSTENDPIFPILTLEEQDIDSAVRNSGLTALEKKNIYIPKSTDPSRYHLKGLRWVVAQKTS